MNTTILCLSALCLSMLFVPNELKAAPDSSRTQSSNQAGQAAESQILINRLEEIKSIDKSGLNRSEKKVLRKEVRSIDRQLRSFSGGLYISASALIIILILLVILT